MTRAIAALCIAIGLAGCGATQPTGQSTGQIPMPTGPTAADAQHWANNWCDIALHSTRQDVRNLMGTDPTEKYPEVWTWEGYGYQFNAFFDTTGKVRQLDFNDIQATNEQKALITCPAIRT